VFHQFLVISVHGFNLRIVITKLLVLVGQKAEFPLTQPMPAQPGLGKWLPPKSVINNPILREP
jgi:hypothetical protein